ncbi:MAG TPA: helix-turn-helix domain-containing protein [Acidimicrobiales bacterium]|jgi:AcrR family transcriptional regulator
MILAIKNAIPKPEPAGPADTGGVADRIVRRSLAKREGDYADEVRRLLDAALELMQRSGTTSRPRVADIVGAAGLSNDAFYRHFRSKDDLVNALLEDGSARLRGYLTHQMAKARTPEAQVRRWVEGVLAQADGELAAATLAVLWNGSGADGGMAAGRHFAAAPLATLLHEPFAALGSDAVELEAALAAHATLGQLSDCLWRRSAASRTETERVTTFCLRAVSR